MRRHRTGTVVQKRAALVRRWIYVDDEPAAHVDVHARPVDPYHRRSEWKKYFTYTHKSYKPASATPPQMASEGTESGATIESLTRLCNDFLALDDGETQRVTPGFLHGYMLEVMIPTDSSTVTETELLQFLTSQLGREPTAAELQSCFNELKRSKDDFEHRLAGGGHRFGGPKEANPQGDQVRSESRRLRM